jgi:hypothetical protein
VPLNKLSAAKVKALGPGKYNDGGGLWLWKREDGGLQWVLRVTVHGRRREMGLGGSDMLLSRPARRLTGGASSHDKGLTRSRSEPDSGEKPSEPLTRLRT